MPSADERVQDVRSLALRRGVRAAIALPATLVVVDAVTGDVIAALFASFAAFALLAMADFGGPPRARAGAYLTATAIGAGLVALGTVVSGSAAIATVTTLIVAFVILQVAAFGGAWATGMFATTLGYVLAVTFAGPTAEIPARVAGWSVGGVVATVVALVVLPVYERPALWNLAAVALRRAADYVRSGATGDARDAARAAMTSLQTAYAKAPYRPAGPTVRDQAFIAVMDGLDRLVEVEPSRAVDASANAGSLLRSATADLLDASAAYLTEPDAAAPDLRGVDQARRDHREALSAWAGSALREGDPPDAVLAELETAWWTRIVSFLAVSLAADAMLGRGGVHIDDDVAATLEASAVPAGHSRERVRRVLRGNLALSSVRLRNAVRTAVGLALAVLIADLASVDHAFWVGLATLSVLRSNALATGRTAVQAVGGTVGGFVFVLLFFGVFDAGPTAEWIALPVFAFLAAYAPSAISFIVGQASFTVAIVLLFDIVEPEGWRTGLVRVEDIAIGAGVSLVVGLLLWPRGAIGCLRSVVGAHLRADADYLDAALAAATGSPRADGVARRLHAVDCAHRVGDAYGELLAAPGRLPSDHAMWGEIAGAARRVQGAGDLLVAQAQLGFVAAPYPDAVAALDDEARSLTGALRAQADALQRDAGAAELPPEPTSDRRVVEVATLAAWGGDDDAGASSALAVIWMSEALHAVDLAVRHSAEAVNEISA